MTHHEADVPLAKLARAYLDGYGSSPTEPSYLDRARHAAGLLEVRAVVRMAVAHEIGACLGKKATHDHPADRPNPYGCLVCAVYELAADAARDHGTLVHPGGEAEHAPETTQAERELAGKLTVVTSLAELAEQAIEALPDSMEEAVRPLRQALENLSRNGASLALEQGRRAQQERQAVRADLLTKVLMMVDAHDPTGATGLGAVFASWLREAQRLAGPAGRV